MNGIIIGSLILMRSSLTPPEGYELAWDRIPAYHQTLVRSIQIDRVSSGQSRRRDLSIHLTPWNERSGDGRLWHEVGHVILYASPYLEKLWMREFWPRDKPLGKLVSDYARTSYEEDFAESYKEYLEHGSIDDAGRNSFLRTYVFATTDSVDARGTRIRFQSYHE